MASTALSAFSKSIFTFILFLAISALFSTKKSLSPTAFNRFVILPDIPDEFLFIRLTALKFLWKIKENTTAWKESVTTISEFLIRLKNSDGETSKSL